MEWESRIIGAGPTSILITRSDFASESILLNKLTDAKRQGCVAVVCDLVSTSDGSILPPDLYHLLLSCCDQARICLIVDEAMTAMRCGAPLACQRPEYIGNGGIQADMIAFGKGMGVSGVAINFNGLMMRHLAYHKRDQILQTLKFWRCMVSRPIATPVLIEALGILNVAEMEDWPAKSEQIGAAFREFVHQYAGDYGHKKEIIRGLGAFLAVDREFTKQFRVMAAYRRRSSWARWLPKLNSPAFLDPQSIAKYLIGPGARPIRQAMSEEAQMHGAKPLWCYSCGIDTAGVDWCRTCFLGSCSSEDCAEALHVHECI